MAEMQKKATRESYGEALRDLAEKYPELVVLDADLAAATKTGIFKKAYPERFFDCGIAAYLLNPLKSTYTYEELARDYLDGKAIPAKEELLGKISLKKAWEQGLSSAGNWIADENLSSIRLHTRMGMHVTPNCSFQYSLHPVV